MSRCQPQESKNSVFIVKPDTGVRKTAGELQRRSWKEKNQKSVKNSWDKVSLLLKMYCTLLYNTKESDYSKLAVKTQTSNILFLFSCGMKCIVGSGTWKEVYCRRSAGRSGWEMNFQVAKESIKWATLIIEMWRN